METSSRDRGARSRIREYLALHGPIEDASGGATARLKEAVGYEGESVAFIQLVAAMDRAGEIKREIRGKRTYKILSTAAESAALESSAQWSGGARVPTVSVERGDTMAADIDYDKLARAVLREMARATAGSLGADGVDALISERDRLQEERDEFAEKLAEARQKLRSILGGFGELDASLQSSEDEQRAV